MAAASGMISPIKVGATGAKFTIVEKLAEALNVDAAEFFTGHLASPRS